MTNRDRKGIGGSAQGGGSEPGLRGASGGIGRRTLFKGAGGLALATIEATYPFRADGILTFVAYGIPYFNRLPGGLSGSLVSARMPRLLSDTSRFALEEAVPGPTDVSSANPGVTKQTFNLPVSI